MNRAEKSQTAGEITKEALTIEVTTECNSLCSYCFARAGLKKRETLSLDTATEIMKEGYLLGWRNLHLTGGEPLLWGGLFDLMERARGLGYESVFCNTNGTLLSGELCAFLGRFKDFMTLSISLQGGEEVHDRLRGKGSRERSARGIKNALEAGIKVILFASAGKSLVGDLPRFASSLFQEFRGILGLTIIQLIRVLGDEFDVKDELLDPADFVRMTRALSLLSLTGLPVEILENPLANVVSGFLGMGWFPPAPPLHRPGRLAVMANGHITLSHSSREPLGIYGPGILREVLSSRKYREAVMADETVCPACTYIGMCRKYGMVRPSEPCRDMIDGIPYCQRVFHEINMGL